ncbi:MAG: hypothetical protein K8I00_01025 [Candidatus Omnitrophica bacterium]|nr:hypothetical protein [Candidatus Omnitrophota bacterium]
MRKCLFVAAIIVGSSVLAPDVSLADKFVFNPPDGITYKETATMTRSKDMGSFGKQVDKSEQFMDVRIQRTPEGYNILSTLRDMTFTRDGQKITEPFLTAMLGISMEYQLDPLGYIQDITGLAAVLDKMLASMPDLPPTVKQVLSEDALKNKSMTEYNGRIGDFIGKTFEIGDVWSTESEFTLPDGTTIDYLSVIRFKSMEPCGQTRCVRVEYVYDADPATLKNFVQDIYDELDPAVKQNLEKLTVTETRINGSGTRLIDPATMLIYDEELNRTISVPMALPEQGKIPVVMTETRVYQFDYE